MLLYKIVFYFPFSSIKLHYMDLNGFGLMCVPFTMVLVFGLFLAVIFFNFIYSVMFSIQWKRIILDTNRCGTGSFILYVATSVPFKKTFIFCKQIFIYLKSNYFYFIKKSRTRLQKTTETIIATKSARLHTSNQQGQQHSPP